MTMQIREIVLYSHTGAIRRLKFELGSVNVITGASSTGKTALIDIVDYCLGSDICYVRKGVIRDSVRWYALILQFEHDQVFVARAEPKPGFESSTDMYFDVAREIQVPEMENLLQNTDPDGIVAYLSRRTGIGENLLEPAPGQTRPAFDITIRHALFYVFQDQTDIATSKYLFHRQTEEHIPRTIRDTLPYFLGASDPDQLRKQQELRRERQRLRRLEAEQREREALREHGLSLARALLAEAEEVGLIGREARTDTDPLQRLRDLAASQPDQFRDASEVSGEALEGLRVEHAQLVERYRGIREELRATRTFVESQAGFTREAGEQRARLESVYLFPETEDGNDRCPLCESQLETPVPTLTELQGALSHLNDQLNATTEYRPSLDFYTGRLEREAQDIRRAMAENQDAIQRVIATNERLQQEQRVQARQAHVLGRVSLYLDNHAPALVDALIPPVDLQELSRMIDALAEEINHVATLNRVDSLLRLMSPEMTDWARNRLALRYSEGQVRLNPHLLTVVSDLKRGPVLLTQMGGANNWLGYHLTALLALHRHFVESERPVPRFLFLDQPTSVYYPPDQDKQGSLDVLIDDDRVSVRRMFRFIFDVVQDLAPGLQVIITDHADLNEQWFQDAIADTKWRNGNALIPADWIEEEVPGAASGTDDEASPLTGGSDDGTEDSRG
jgi:Protein of unknown function (DUF3732)